MLEQLPKASIAALAVVTYLTYTILQWYRLSHIPGPFWVGFSKYWMVKESLKGRQPLAIKEVTDKYGSLARIGPNELVTDDPEVLRRINGVRSLYTRGPWYDAFRFDPTWDNLLSMRNDAEHTALRAKMAAGYSGKENESMEITIDTQVAALVDLIETKYLSTAREYRPMDLAQKAQYFTLDVISHLAFGRSFGYLEKDADVFGYIRITESSLPVMVTMADVPLLARLLQSRLFRGLMPSERDGVGFGSFIGIAKKIVSDRFHPNAPPQPDMLGSFIRHGLTQDQASSETLLQVIAGSDTSATTIRIALLNLLTNPPAYRKLQQEIDEAIAAAKISSPVTDAEARRHLPYLQAVIREALRILPPAGGTFFKTVPAGGDVICGRFVPGGTQVGSSPLGVQWCRGTFGEDAEVFRPERWLVGEDDRDGEKEARMADAVDLVFHCGKWQCLGKTVALMEFNKVFVELLRRFDFCIVHPEKPAHITNAGIWIMNNFWVRVTRRKT